MPGDTFRTRAEELLAPADVAVNGDRPWDIRVHDERFYARVFAEGELGLGEAYMDGWWDCERLDEFICRALRADLRSRIRPWSGALRVLAAKVVNLQKPSRAFEVGRRHYDIGRSFGTATTSASTGCGATSCCRPQGRSGRERTNCGSSSSPRPACRVATMLTGEDL